MTSSLALEKLSSPDETTCGPTCLHAGYRYWGCAAGDIWNAVAERLDREQAPRREVWRAPVEFALTRGPLARRLLRAIGPRPDRAALHELYTALCNALASGPPFDP